jgi:hypothetical protein
MTRYTREQKRELRAQIEQMNVRIREYLDVRHRASVARRNAIRLRRARERLQEDRALDAELKRP